MLPGAYFQCFLRREKRRLRRMGERNSCIAFLWVHVRVIACKPFRRALAVGIGGLSPDLLKISTINAAVASSSTLHCETGSVLAHTKKKARTNQDKLSPLSSSPTVLQAERMAQSVFGSLSWRMSSIDNSTLNLTGGVLFSLPSNSSLNMTTNAFVGLEMARIPSLLRTICAQQAAACW